ncbi:hypothetical protein C8R43DRAFT_1186682 [Mycena crocata]|nr:hypothetical protein C8R43DRAFT_1186682 [Mycena crocata]
MCLSCFASQGHDSSSRQAPHDGTIGILDEEVAIWYQSNNSSDPVQALPPPRPRPRPLDRRPACTTHVGVSCCFCALFDDHDTEEAPPRPVLMTRFCRGSNNPFHNSISSRRIVIRYDSLNLVINHISTKSATVAMPVDHEDNECSALNANYTPLLPIAVDRSIAGTAADANIPDTSTPDDWESAMDTVAEGASLARCLALNLGHTVLVWTTMVICAHSFFAVLAPDDFAASLPVAIGIGVWGTIMAFICYLPCTMVALYYCECFDSLFPETEDMFALVVSPMWRPMPNPTWSGMTLVYYIFGTMVVLLGSLLVESDVLGWKQAFLIGVMGGGIYGCIMLTITMQIPPVSDIFIVRLGVQALKSALIILCGHGVLAAVAPLDYTPTIRSSPAVGLCGGAAIFIICNGFHEHGFAKAYAKSQADKDYNCDEETKETRRLGPALLGVLTGVIGVLPFKAAGVETLSYAHAVCVGAVGGALMGYIGLVIKVA